MPPATLFQVDIETSAVSFLQEFIYREQVNISTGNPDLEDHRF